MQEAVEQPMPPSDPASLRGWHKWRIHGAAFVVGGTWVLALVVLVAGVRPRDTAYLGIMFVVLMGALVSAEAQSVFRSRPEWREAYPAKERWTGWMTSLSIAMAMLLVLVGWSSGG